MSMGNGRERNHGRVASGRDTVNEQQKMVIKYADANMTVNTPLSWVQIDTVGPKPPFAAVHGFERERDKVVCGKNSVVCGKLNLGNREMAFRLQASADEIG